MKLLIISSEPLNTSDILSSTFELSQAKLLQEIGDVSILSVSRHDSFGASAKSLFAKIFRLKESLVRFLKVFGKLVVGYKNVNFYSIEGVPVFEGTNFQWISSHGFLPNLKNWLVAGHAAYRKYEKTSGRPDIIHAHGRFLNAGVLALEIKKLKGIPYVYTDHSTVYQTGAAPVESRPILNDIVDNAAVVVTVSRGLLNQMEYFLGRQIQEAMVMPNTLDPLFETPVVPKAGRTGGIQFLAIASLHKKKGLDILLKAFKNAFEEDMQVKLSICGDGPLRNELLKLREELGLSRQVSFEGNLPKNMIIKKLDEADAVVVSSRDETFGVVVIEALSRGCPVIATRSGGPEYILTSEWGIIIEKNNVSALVEAMKNMKIQCKAYNREKMHEYAVSKFGKQAFLYSSRQLYSRVLNPIK